MNRWRALTVISVSVLFALSLWFSATAVLPQLFEEWQLTSQQSASMTTAVQFGFIVGALFLTWTRLADTVNGRYLFAVSAIIGALSNYLFTLSPTITMALLMRFLTGVMLAGVYPTSVRLVSTWFQTRKGTAVGIIIGALTVGSALPHLVKTFASEVDWENVIYASSMLAILAALMMYFILPDAQQQVTKAQLNQHENAFQKVLRNQPVMLSNYGYFGHNWELYAMWTWMPLFLMASIQQAELPQTVQQLAPILAFCIIGIAGAIGAVCGGLIADKIGKAQLAKWSMIVSGLCSLCIGFTYGGSIWLTVFIALIWGAAIIADSAQFSALATEYADPYAVGTALTFQMAVGYLLTIISIYTVPLFVDLVSWQWAFCILAIGPFLGAYSMQRLIQYERGSIQN